MPQKGNRTGLQEVRGEEGGVQPGRVAKEDGEEGGEGGRKATDVVFGVSGTGLADSGQYGLNGKAGNGGG